MRAHVEKAQGDYAAARRDYERAVAMGRRDQRPDGPSVPMMLVELSRTQYRQGEYAAARATAERAVALSEQLLGPSAEFTFAARAGLASLPYEDGLSTCGSGLGKVASGESVVGLRRAFEVAGAGTLVMSLWNVRDVETRRFMQGLYAARLAGNSTPDAMRSAALEVLSERRRTGRATHPYDWGAFVAAGAWR
jgi:hypothetical protein